MSSAAPSWALKRSAEGPPAESQAAKEKKTKEDKEKGNGGKGAKPRRERNDRNKHLGSLREAGFNRKQEAI
eukprot:7327951-Pyramimonas_sp.AAC.1